MALQYFTLIVPLSTQVYKWVPAETHKELGQRTSHRFYDVAAVNGTPVSLAI